MKLRWARPRSLTADVFLTLGSRFGVLLVNAALGIVVARALGPTGRGALAVAFAFTYLLVQFGILGLHSANAYFASREPEQIGRILVNTLWATLGFGALLGAVGVGVRVLFPSALRGLDLLEVGLVLVAVPAVLTVQLLQGLLLAEGRMVAYNGVEFGIASTTALGMVVALIVFSGGVLSAISVFAAVNTAGALAIVALLRRHISAVRRFDLQLFRAMLRYGFRLYLAALLAFLVWRTNLLLVNSYRGGSSAGQFSIAVALGDTIHLLPTVVALNLFPRIARGDESTDTGAVFRSLTLVYGAFCLAIVPLVGPLIRLLYGHAFSGAVGMTYWLLPGIFCYGMVSVLSYHFAGRGFPMRALGVWLVGVAVNLAIALPTLAEGHSAPFAAAAVSVAYLVVLVLHVQMFAHESGGYRSLIPRPRETGLLLAGAARSLAAPRVRIADDS